ncbi:MAG TPA: hypothetical protein VD927_01515 [Chryseosolibacter sp.]|nr:hypothetical protein [Chryseosolibacter sp.]
MSRTAIQELFQEDIYRISTPLLVVLPKPWNHILEEELALLTKILGSVKLSIGSVNIQTFERITPDKLASLRPGKVLIFGSVVEDVTLNPYEKVVIMDIPVIKADDLSQLDDQKKKSLWIALKQMFNL